MKIHTKNPLFWPFTLNKTFHCGAKWNIFCSEIGYTLGSPLTPRGCPDWSHKSIHNGLKIQNCNKSLNLIPFFGTFALITFSTVVQSKISLCILIEDTLGSLLTPRGRPDRSHNLRNSSFKFRKWSQNQHEIPFFNLCTLITLWILL